MFPGASAEQKVKAMNFLLPHIRRMPEKLARDQFAADAAQKLGIDSAVLREELRQAALKRRDRVEVRPAMLTEVERVLLRALAITDPEGEQARDGLRSKRLPEQPAWFEHLGSISGSAGTGRPRGQRSDGSGGGSGQRACWPRRCWAKPSRRRRPRCRARFRRFRNGRSKAGSGTCGRQIAEAERRGDFAELALLTQQKLELDRALRQLHRPAGRRNDKGLRRTLRLQMQPEILRRIGACRRLIEREQERKLDMPAIRASRIA